MPALAYTLVVDKELSYIINIMLQASMEDERFKNTLKKENLIDRMEFFLKELAEKEHATGMCDDPDCEHEK